MARAILMAAAEEERLRKNLRLDRRVLRQASKPLMLPDNEFVAHFRLHKAQYQILCADVIPLLPAPQRSSAVLPEIKILAALAFFAEEDMTRDRAHQPPTLRHPYEGVHLDVDRGRQAVVDRLWRSRT